MEKTCLTCSSPFIKFVERKDTGYSKKIVEEEKEFHYHYGVAYYNYGVCQKHHMTRCEQTRIVWTNCKKCGTTEEQFTEIDKLKKEVDILKKILGVTIHGPT